MLFSLWPTKESFCVFFYTSFVVATQQYSHSGTSSLGQHMQTRLRSSDTLPQWRKGIHISPGSFWCEGLVPVHSHHDSPRQSHRDRCGQEQQPGDNNCKTSLDTDVDKCCHEFSWGYPMNGFASMSHLSSFILERKTFTDSYRQALSISPRLANTSAEAWSVAQPHSHMCPAHWRHCVVGVRVASPKPQPAQNSIVCSSLNMKINFKTNGTWISQFPGTTCPGY